MRRALIGLALAVAVGGLWLLRELRTPSPEASEAPGARASGATVGARSTLSGAPTGPASVADGPASPELPGELPPPVGGARPWSTAPAPADGPDPFAPVPTVRTEADTRVGLPP